MQRLKAAQLAVYAVDNSELFNFVKKSASPPVLLSYGSQLKL
jgi:hypothetical protein